MVQTKPFFQSLLSMWECGMTLQRIALKWKSSSSMVSTRRMWRIVCAVHLYSSRSLRSTMPNMTLIARVICASVPSKRSSSKLSMVAVPMVAVLANKLLVLCQHECQHPIWIVPEWPPSSFENSGWDSSNAFDGAPPVRGLGSFNRLVQPFFS